MLTMLLNFYSGRSANGRTAGFVNPNVWVEVKEGIELYMENHGFRSVQEITKH